MNSDDQYKYHKSLQEEIDRLTADKEALQKEFNNLADTDDGTMSPEAARKALIASAPVAIQQICTLAAFGDSESVRLNASKYIVDVSLGKVQVGDPADNAFRDFLETLKKPVTKHNVEKVKSNLEVVVQNKNNKGLL